jgi:integrase
LLKVLGRNCLAAYARTRNDQATLDAIGWHVTNVSPGGAAGLLDRVSSTDQFLTAILYFLTLDPNAPPAADPRSALSSCRSGTAGPGGDGEGANHSSRAGRTVLPPELTFHALRHSYASLCVAAGIGADKLSRRLGHAKITTTLDATRICSPTMTPAATWLRLRR